jgi:hypothetical protein
MEGNEFDDIDELADDDNKKKVPQPKSWLPVYIDALAFDVVRALAVMAIRILSSRLKYQTSRGNRPKKFSHESWNCRAEKEGSLRLQARILVLYAQSSPAII